MSYLSNKLMMSNKASHLNNNFNLGLPDNITLKNLAVSPGGNIGLQNFKTI
jgi:hypothetical protein